MFKQKIDKQGVGDLARKISKDELSRIIQLCASEQKQDILRERPREKVSCEMRGDYGVGDILSEEQLENVPSKMLSSLYLKDCFEDFCTLFSLVLDKEKVHTEFRSADCANYIYANIMISRADFLPLLAGYEVLQKKMRKGRTVREAILMRLVKQSDRSVFKVKFIFGRRDVTSQKVVSRRGGAVLPAQRTVVVSI